MGHTIADFRNLLNQIEQISETIAKEYDVEHLAGPQGWPCASLRNGRKPKPL